MAGLRRRIARFQSFLMEVLERGGNPDNNR